MAYDSNKDKLVKLFEMKDEEKSLLFQILSYDNAPRKLQITRMFKKKDETYGYSSAGRLSLEEVSFFKDNLDEIINIMNENPSR